jgi:hypothetical protein
MNVVILMGKILDFPKPTRLRPMAETIEYNPNLVIRNLDALPSGTGLKIPGMHPLAHWRADSQATAHAHPWNSGERRGTRKVLVWYSP